MNKKNPLIPEDFHRLGIVVDRPRTAQFFLLLQQGVRMSGRVGCSVEVFLLQEMKVALATIEKIQSIMLNGKPVDDITASLVQDGSTLALSAAMPGLVGATLRRGGAYASLRSGITYHEAETKRAPSEGWVNVKIFNLLMAEIGPSLLRTGVLIEAAHLYGLVKERAKELRGLKATLDGKPVDLEKLNGELRQGRKEVHLTVSEWNPAA